MFVCEFQSTNILLLKMAENINQKHSRKKKRLPYKPERGTKSQTIPGHNMAENQNIINTGLLHICRLCHLPKMQRHHSTMAFLVDIQNQILYFDTLNSNSRYTIIVEKKKSLRIHQISSKQKKKKSEDPLYQCTSV